MRWLTRLDGFVLLGATFLLELDRGLNGRGKFFGSDCIVIDQATEGLDGRWKEEA